MAVKCLNCGYEMSTYQEVTSTLAHIASGIFGSTIGQNTRNNKVSGLSCGFLGGFMNQGLGTSKGVKCPKCGEIGRWEDK